jgi:hypothetical protein
MVRQIDSSRERCVYVFLNPIKPGFYKYNSFEFYFEPFYVGQGHLGRPREHGCGEIDGERHYHLMHELYNKGLCYLSLLIKRGLTKEESLQLEFEVIKSIGRRDINTGPLFNLSDGGVDGWGFGMKIDKTYMTGDNNWMRYRDTTGSKNNNARYKCVALSPNKELYYVGLGDQNRFAEFMQFPTSTFKQFNGNTGRWGSMKGWTVYKLNSSQGNTFNEIFDELGILDKIDLNKLYIFKDNAVLNEQDCSKCLETIQ